MATPNPLSETSSAPPVSPKAFAIAGITTVVYGLSELPPNPTSISCLWLLHPRLQTKDIMAAVASSCINDWYSRPSSDQQVKVGLIAVAFDQRNHGSRLVNSSSNEAWREGNVTHAQDMFSIFHGTAMDTSLLIDHLGSYIFNGPDEPPINQHIVMGISLGGHAAWQVLFNDPRVTAGVIIIGCPDYMRMMTDRARLSKLPTYTYTTTSPPGSSFLGSPDFPTALITSVSKSDPRGLLFGTAPIPTPSPAPSPAEQARLGPLLDARIRNKKILVCSGAADKLVPYHCSQPLLDFLKAATEPDAGWYRDGGVSLDDRVYEGVGHAYSEDMARDVVRFVSEFLASGGGEEV
ncbi:hypothetical protein LZ554_007429 [Drepanopeziza brunnea f. sp. 'monogermtubi']|nr:hypothetical protein LZ554_007429 [Drepanopeziza brunnea f. sp. 'monogermtubi']